VQMESLPTFAGKLDRQALPAPDERPRTTYVAPRTPLEAALARAWEEVLRIERIGIHDNFFELGGDSIQLIKVASRANRGGARVTVRDLFEHQTIAELARVSGTGPSAAIDQGAVEGDVPLTPIQHAFFEMALPNPDYFNLPALIAFRTRVSVNVLETAINHLVSHHDALGSTFVRDGDTWRQHHDGARPPLRLERIDLSAYDPSARSTAFTQAARDLQASLNLGAGELSRVALFEFGLGERQRLLWVVHHLAVDGVSWRILLDDLRTVYRQIEQHDPVELPPKTTSYQRWAEQLVAYASSEAGRDELRYWLSRPWPQVRPLPRDHRDGINTTASARSVVRALTKGETDALLYDVPMTYRVQIHDVLLTALGQALADWSGNRTVLVDVEGHGREEVLEHVDVSRTVGFFTSLYPVVLDLGGDGDLIGALSAVKEQLRVVPRRGVGYGALKYLGSHAALRELPGADISFNYLGRLDHDLTDGTWFELAADDIGPLHDSAGLRRHPIAVSGSILEGRLHLRLAFSAHLHETPTLERLADGIVAHLRTLIRHSLDSEGTFASGDFPLIEFAPTPPAMEG